MAAPLNVGMPLNVDVPPGYTLQVNAIDAATGATVSGVLVTTMTIEAAGTGDLSSGSFQVANPILLGIGT